MNAAEIDRIRNNPSFRELERKRNTFSWSLFAVIVAIYGGFIFLVAFAPAIVAQPLGQGPFTLAFPLGLGVIAAAILLTGLYVIRANSEFDRLTRAVVADMGRPSTNPTIPFARVA